MVADPFLQGRVQQTRFIALRRRPSVFLPVLDRQLPRQDCLRFGARSQDLGITMLSFLPVQAFLSPLGFEAPQFVPIRDDAGTLTAARKGESGPSLPTRPFSAGAGAVVLVTSLVVAPMSLGVCARRCQTLPQPLIGNTL